MGSPRKMPRSRLVHRLLCAALLLCAFVPALPAQGAAISYAIVDLGTLGGTESFAMGINTGGDVVGYSRTATGLRHAFLYRGGGMTDLGTLGGAESTAFALNDADQIVGESTTATGETHAFLWSDGAMVDLGTLGGTYSSAASINASGEIVGTSTAADGERHAFVYSGGSIKDLGTFGGVNSTGEAINDAGDIVGTWTKAGGEFGSFLHRAGSTIILDALRAGAEDINNSGQITGAMPTPVTTAQHAFLYSNGVTTDLGTLNAASFGVALNDAGQVVGYNTNTQGGAADAFVSEGGVMQNLRLLIPPDSGWLSLRNATDVNAGGQIVGQGFRDGQFRAFLLTPFSSPAVVLSDQPAALSTSASASFVFSSSADATFVCSLDLAPDAACTSPAEYTDLADGPHSFSVRAKDAAGNFGPPETYSWTVDTRPPTVSLFQRPTDPSASRDARFAWDGETGATYRCSLDGAAFAACSSPVVYTGLADGTHNFSVVGTDTAGNTVLDGSEAATRFSWTIDATGPTVTLLETPADPSASTSARFVFSSEAGAFFECKLDDRAYSSCSSPWTYGSMTNGPHSFSVRGTDALGNVGPGSAYSWTVNVVATPPPPVASIPAKDRLVAAKSALELKKAQVAAPAQMYVQFAIDSLNRALEPARWSTVGLSLNDQSRDTLGELRMATGWLYWADADVRAATAGEQTEIIRAMGEIVRQRFTDVFNFVGEGGQRDAWAIWASEYLLNEGDRLLADGSHLSASLYYASAWDYLLHQPPCC